MPTLAAIDVGSNGFRLVIGEIDAERKLTIVESIREPIRLGQDVFAGGQIPDETIERAGEAFRRFKELIDRHGAKWTRAVATSAVREASNRDFLVDRVAQASGIEISVIGAEEEARLIYLAVAARIPLAGKLGMLIDIGGGSAEITLTSDGQIMTTESFRMGAVRLLQVLEEKRNGTKKFNQLVREYADAAQKRIQKEIGSRTIGICIGTGGNIESLGDLRRDVLGKESNALILADELDELVRRLQGMTYEQRIQELLLRPDRADVIVPAAIVVQKILSVAKVGEMLIPNVGLKDGLLIDMIQELYGEKKGAHRDQVMASALQIGRKYLFDEQHGTTTAKHAVKLFDETRQLHHLGMEFRILLEVAALLHDIGHFINMTAHHKHTLYLLSATPVIGLTPAQLAVVANVARYHRKSSPKPSHDQYQALSSKDRVVVSKLAALLRLADAMDNEHSSRVADFDVAYRKPKLTLTLKGEGDLLLERWSLARKATMFAEVFSTRVVVSD